MKKKLLYLLLLIIPKIGFGQCTLTSATQTGTNTSATSCVCPPGGGSNCDLIPDISIAKLPLNQSSNYTEYPQVCNPPCDGNDGRLRIGVSTPIIGYGPLETRGTTKYVCGTDTVDAGSLANIPSSCPGTGLPPKQLVNQRIYRKNGNSMNYWERPAGSMTYHASHGHQHIDDWGIYTLRTNNGNPNPLNWPIIGTGSKLGFCLIDLGTCQGSSGYCTDTAGNTLNQSNIPNYGLGPTPDGYSCNNTVQGITNGFMDTYSQSLDGMWINLPAGVCNGTYYLVVQIDPYNYFLETNENNNVAAVPITLTQQTAFGTTTISANKTMPICTSDNVTLSTISGSAYLWNTGATNQSINVSTTGNYTVTVTNACGTAVSSPFVVTTTGPNAPTTTNDSVCNSGSMTLTASNTGTINWYSTSTGGNSIGTGTSFITPVLNISTTYYAEATSNSGGATLFSPPSANTIGSGGQFSGNQYLSFNVTNPCTLKSVKLYANIAGTFTVQLQNSSGLVINSASITVPAGESRATLNFSLTPGTAYRLTRSGNFSLYRNSSGASYPYTVTNYVSITGSSGGSSYYYFFYDWEILTPIQTCSSSRTPATATVKPNPVVSVNAGSTSICTGQSTTLTASGATTYVWSPAAGLSSTTGSVVTASPSVTTTYTATGTTNGCNDSEPVTIQVSTSTVPAKPASISGQKSGVCNATKTYTTPAVSGATNYIWNAPSGANILSGQGTTSVQVQYTTGFSPDSLCVAANNFCGTSARKCYYIKAVPPQPSAMNGLTSVCANQTNVAYSTPAVNGATSYVWKVPSGSQITSGQGTTGITVNFGVNGGILSVRGKNSCGKGFKFNNTITINCKTVKPDNDLRGTIELFPNPAKDFVEVNYNAVKAGSDKLIITDVMGRELFKQNIITIEGENKFNITLSNFSKGVYIIFTEQSGKRISKKLIID